MWTSRSYARLMYLLSWSTTRTQGELLGESKSRGRQRSFESLVYPQRGSTSALTRTPSRSRRTHRGSRKMLSPPVVPEVPVVPGAPVVPVAPVGTLGSVPVVLVVPVVPVDVVLAAAVPVEAVSVTATLPPLQAPPTETTTLSVRERHRRFVDRNA